MKPLEKKRLRYAMGFRRWQKRKYTPSTRKEVRRVMASLRGARDGLLLLIDRYPHNGTLVGAIEGVEIAMDELVPRRKDSLK